jgi:hypothetical protein
MGGRIFDQVERVLAPSRGRPLAELDLGNLAREARGAFRRGLQSLGRDPRAYRLIVHADAYAGTSCTVSGPGEETWPLDEFDRMLSGQS